ncbi:hypothetical protein [Rubripirellula lacrimiformis]|nr:hypothetical protein [Rubripirellula lacrimiformis]
MEWFNKILQWWSKQPDPRAQLMKSERKKTEAMAKRLDNNQKKDRVKV